MHTAELQEVRDTARFPGQCDLIYSDAPWYAAYTCPRHEKYVAEQLIKRQIGSFLPLYSSVRRWKDRRKRIDLPLFPGYVFVQMTERNRLDILRLPGVVQLVCFQGKPAAIAPAEIEALRRGTTGSLVVQPHPYLKEGRKVRIISGPMAGTEGIFVRRKHQTRLVVSISLIQRSVAMEIDEDDVEPVS
jgi:transcription elongation factor/antiterminator RfaH